MEQPAIASQPLADQMETVASGAHPKSSPGPTVCPSSFENLDGSGSLSEEFSASLPVASTSTSTAATSVSSALELVGHDYSADVSMVDALAERALHQQVDESMESAVPPPVATTSPPADPRPTLADVLSQHDHLRRDRADNDAARRRVETPKPLACDIEWIERQYAAGGDWSFIASRID